MFFWEQFVEIFECDRGKFFSKIKNGINPAIDAKNVTYCALKT